MWKQMARSGSLTRNSVSVVKRWTRLESEVQLEMCTIVGAYFSSAQNGRWMKMNWIHCRIVRHISGWIRRRTSRTSKRNIWSHQHPYSEIKCIGLLRQMTRLRIWLLDALIRKLSKSENNQNMKIYLFPIKSILSRRQCIRSTSILSMLPLNGEYLKKHYQKLWLPLSMSFNATANTMRFQIRYAKYLRLHKRTDIPSSMRCGMQNKRRISEKR